MNVAVLNLPQRKAQVILREVAKDTSRLMISAHAKDRMLERGVNIRQILKAFERGSFIETPCWNPLKGSHEFSLSYHYAGVRLKVVAAIEGYIEVPDHETVIVITVVKV